MVTAARADAQIRRELVIVDAATPNYHQLLQDVIQNPDGTRQIEALLIEPGVDGVAAIGQILARYRDLDAVHLISHGRAGGVQLGSATLSADNLAQYAHSIRGWAVALNQDADILFYGCGLAGSASGQQLVDQIGALTGADVAASTDVTGAATRGGDWDLEYAAGHVETTVAISPAAQAEWDGQLLVAQMFYVPLPEDQIKASLTALYSSTGTTIDSTLSIVPAQINGIIYYDHWEDGYEANIEAPTQASTKIWGDNNPANGIPPGFATDVLSSNFETTTTLNQGQSYQVNGGVLTGARILANKNIQVHWIVGDVGTTYESDWFTLYPRNQWSSTYYNPVGTTVADDPAATFLYNPNAFSINVQVQSLAGTQIITVPAATDATAHGLYRFQMPTNSGAHFHAVNPAHLFFALGAMDTDTSGTGNNVHDWGFTLVPDTYLTPALKVGWAPGSGDQPISANGSPVWVMAVSPTRVYADYDGNPTTGALTDPNGNKYDVHFDVVDFQSVRIYDPDKDQTGMRVYTVSGVKMTGAWGQDPATAQPGNPFLDVGYTVLPLPVFYARKDGAVIENADGTGQVAIPDNVSGTPYPLDAPGYTITTLSVGEAKRVRFRVTAVSPPAGTVLNIATIDGGGR